MIYLEEPKISLKINRKTMLKIAFINIFRNSYGGGEVYLARLIQSLNKNKKFSILLISPKCQVLNDTNVPQLEIIGTDGNNKISSIFNLLYSIYQINTFLRRYEFDYIVINGDRAILLSHLINHPRIIGIKHMLINTNIKCLLNKLAFKNISKLITISKFHKKNYTQSSLLKPYKNKIEIIYNSVNTLYFSPSEKIDDGRFHFIEIASIEKRKGQEDLIHAFDLLKKKYENIELHLLGQGSNEKVCKNLVAELNLDSSVHFHGYHRNIQKFFQYKDTVFVLPSYDEGLPISILEALSCEVPVISTNIAGIPECVYENINGFLVSPGEIEQLACKMELFILHKDNIRSMGHNGRMIVKEKFDEANWISRWEKVFISD